MTEKIMQKLQRGGYQVVNFRNVPCRVMIRRKEKLYVICLFDEESLARLTGGVSQFDGLLDGICAALQTRFPGSFECLAIVVSSDIGRDRMRTRGMHAVWLVDENGKIIIFDDQPSSFDGVESLIEKKSFSGKGNIILPGADFPWVTIGIVAVNVLIHLITWIQELGGSSSGLQRTMVLLIRDFKNEPEYYRLLTSAFLHFGWAHLFNNMLVLTYLGKSVERITGHGKFLAAYLFCAIGANIASVFWYIANGRLSVATAGASGAVFGVAGMVLVWMLLNKGHMDQVNIRQVVLMIVFTLYNGIAENRMNGSGVNNCAHIAGMLLGILCGLVLYLLDQRKRDGDRRTGTGK